MLAYRTMEDTMAGIPTGKGTFDPLNKNNFHTKMIMLHMILTYSAKCEVNLPQAQVGLGVLAPEYLPSEDQAIADAMLSYLPGTQAAAANAAVAANQQAATVQQNVQAAQAPATPAPANTKAAASTGKHKTNKTSTTGATSKTSSTGDLMSFNQPFWDEYSGLGQSGAFVYDVPGINFKDPKEREEELHKVLEKIKYLWRLRLE